jgi:phosphopentomutase
MRAILLIIDSFGIGALPDADSYGDKGANTALSICKAMKTVCWPNLQILGLGNCSALLARELPGCEAVREPLASYGVMMAASSGKDTTTGHWELAGIVMEPPFPTFAQHYPSFPEKLLKRLSKETGQKILGNLSASGTAIIDRLGPAHLNGDGIIVYTSADSVLQIAAHEDIVAVTELYTICETARRLCDPYRIGRVIARPFIGEIGNFSRTANRKDFSMEPPEQTILDLLQKNGVETVAVGKIGDIFTERGIDRSFHDSGNRACLERLTGVLRAPARDQQFIFVNLVDTDMLFGHRRDLRGYHDAVEKIDRKLPEICKLMAEEDILIISADHGCDPGFKGSDHTREYVPLLVYAGTADAVDLGIRQSFCDVAQSLASFFSIEPLSRGTSFIPRR